MCVCMCVCVRVHTCWQKIRDALHDSKQREITQYYNFVTFYHLSSSWGHNRLSSNIRNRHEIHIQYYDTLSLWPANCIKKNLILSAAQIPSCSLQNIFPSLAIRIVLTPIQPHTFTDLSSLHIFKSHYHSSSSCLLH